MRIAALFFAVLLVPHLAEATSHEIPKTTKLYSDLLSPFRAFHEDLSDFSVLDKKPIDRVHSVVLVHATVLPEKLIAPSREQDFRQDAFGLFVINSVSGQLHMPIDIFATKRWGDYEVTLVEVDERHIDIRRQGATYGDVADKVRYFLDLKQKKVLTAITHFGMNIYSMVEFQGSLYFLGTGDGTTTVITRLRSMDHADNPSGYEVTDTINGEKIERVRMAIKEEQKLILTSDSKRYVLTDLGWRIFTNPEPNLFRHNPGSGKPVGVPSVTFWVPLYKVQENIVPLPDAKDPSHRLLVWNKHISVNSGSYQKSGIYDIGADGHSFYAFPNPTMKEFKQYRPGRVTDEKDEEYTTIETEIGPFEFLGTRLWFGTSFYAGEGFTGIGGIGYFDTDTKRYHVMYLKEIADWSISAIHIDKQYVWMGLFSYGGGSGDVGGLVRYDRTARRVKRYAVPKMVNVIRRFGNRVSLGTSDGVYFLADGRVSQVAFELDVNAKYVLRVKHR